MWQVVLVEDEHDSAEMVTEILSHHGIQVYLARNGFECLDLLQQIEPNLVVTDLAMPEMDGWRTLSEMRSNPQTAHIPVIAITAYHSVNVAQDALNAGFDAYFAKPFSPDSLMDGIRRMLH
jgi:CheY-like chemotaxis protein